MAYNRQIYVKASQELRRRKEKAENERKQHHDEVCLKFPEILLLEREMARTGAEAVKAIGMGADAEEYIKKISEVNLKAQKRRKEILTENGYAEDYLETKYTCPKCKDTGYCGEYICDCFKQTAKQIAFDELNRSSPMKLCDFSSFKTEKYPNVLDPATGVVPREHMGAVLKFCMVYAEEFSLDSPSLLMYGKTGLGKTHLSLSIAKKVTEKGFAVVYDTVPNIMNKLEKEHFSRNYANAGTDELLFNCDLLILDDLGAEFQTSFTVSSLYNIINNRLLSGLPTIISTNLDPKEIEEKYTQRIASRFVGTYFNLGFCGNDIRQKS